MKKNIINRGVVLLFVIAGMVLSFRADAQQAPVVRCNQGDSGCGCENQSCMCAVTCSGATVESPQYRVTYDCRDIDMDDSCSVPGRVVPEGGDDGIPVAQMCALPIIRVQGRPIGSTEGVAFESCDITCEDRTGRVPIYRGHGDLCGRALLEAYNNLGYPVWIIGLDDTQNNMLLADCANNIDGRLQQQQAEQQPEQEMQACRDEAARIRSTLAPLPAQYGCDGNRASSDRIASVQRCAPDIRERWYPCRGNCENDCASVSVACNVYAPASDGNLNARGIEEDITRCNQMCNDDLARMTAGMPNCGAGEMQDTGITPEDLAEGGEGDEPWEPNGGWGPQEEAGGEEEEIDNEDLPAPAGEDQEDAGETGYSRNDYEREVHERAMENRRNGMSPQEAEDRAIADARSEINQRSVEQERNAIAELLDESNPRFEEILQGQNRGYQNNADQYRGDANQRRETEMPQRIPAPGSTNPTTRDVQTGQLIGEGQNGRATGDPVINGTFCYDKVFGKETTPVEPPVEVTGRYCSYQNPDITASGALGPGWTLNVESHIRYIVENNSLYYQDPDGNMINFVRVLDSQNGVLLSPENLKNSCDANFGFTADFRAVGQPLNVHAEIHADPADCHSVLFDFLLTDALGNKSYFKRAYNFSQPYFHTTSVANVGQSFPEPESRSARGYEAWYNRRIPPFIQSVKDNLQQKHENRQRIWRDNDPGPLDLYLLSQNYHLSSGAPNWSHTVEQALLPGTLLGSTLIYRSHDIGFFTASEDKGRFLSYAFLPQLNVVAPIVRWEDAAGNATTVERRTLWDKYYAASIVYRNMFETRTAVGEIQEGAEDYRGRPVRSYSYDRRQIETKDDAAYYKIYETLLPAETEVTLHNGDTTATLSFRYRMEYDASASAAFRNAGLFPAPIYRANGEPGRDDIMVLRPRPILVRVDGNQKSSLFLYGYVSNAGVCNPDLLLDIGAYWSVKGKEISPQAQANAGVYPIDGCNREEAVRLKSAVSNVTTFAGPLVLTAFLPPNPDTGEPGDGDALKSEYFLYEPASPPQGVGSRLHYIRMTETGFLDASPFEMGMNTPFNVARTPYIVNTYNDDNLVETHQLGDTGAIQYAYSNCTAPCNNLYSINVTSRGGVSERFRFYGQIGRGENMETHTYDTGGENEKTIFYEYESAPQGKPHVRGRIKAIESPGARRIEYTYHNAGDSFDFSNYQPHTITTRVGRNGANLQRVVFDYVMPQGEGPGKISRITIPAPNSETGNERVATDLIYDFQPAAQNEGLNPCNADQPQGNLVKKINPDGTYEAWKHNKKGQPIFYRNPFGIETTYSYFGTGEGCGS